MCTFLKGEGSGVGFQRLIEGFLNKVLANTDRTHFSKRSWQTQYNEMAAMKTNRDRDWNAFVAWMRQKKEGGKTT